MQALANSHTCFAFDTPGFGDSSPLDCASPGMAALADALAETLLALRFPPCAVFGSHTGAVIALELARRHPAQVTGLILDGFPLYTSQEQSEHFAGYFAPLVLDELGGHFAHSWTRFRDLFLWFPWNQKIPDNLNDTDAPTAQRLHLWVSMFFRAAEHYAAPYRAAIEYGSGAAEAICSLTTPAVFMAHSADMLYSHLDRLPALRVGQSIERMSRAEKNAAMVRAVARIDATGVAPADPAVPAGAPFVSRHFLDFAHGQLLVRVAGDPAAQRLPLLLLHDAPGSSLSLEPLLCELAGTRRVITLDLPGCGESMPLADSRSSLGYCAALVTQVLDRLGVSRCALYGCGFGSSLALELAAQNPQQYTQVLLHGLCLPAAAQRQEMLLNYAPTINIEADGSHWYRTWLMLRDTLIYFPWYAGRAAALRRVEVEFDARQLHERTFEVLKQSQGYPQFIHAALGQDAARRCADVVGAGVAVQVCADPLHPFAAYAEQLGTLVQTLQIPFAASSGPLAALQALA